MHKSFLLEVLSSAGRQDVFRAPSRSLPGWGNIGENVKYVYLVKMSGHYFAPVLFFTVPMCSFPKRCLEGFTQADSPRALSGRAEEKAGSFVGCFRARPYHSCTKMLSNSPLAELQGGWESPTGTLPPAHCPMHCWSVNGCNCRSESHFNDKCFQNKAIKFLTQLLTLNELFRLFPSTHPTPINLFLRGMYLWSHVLLTWLRLKIALETHSS